ncbi:GspE/PulE family protein [Acidisphaera rubrifaciens]|uniref:Secretion system type II kinase GspE n=1 Tax=Acidisphaera rubrifaciens HS-AP3 TaxID=1231350 RepID=A0A0D6PA51_9PROT|nr:ATPase, T2SS/T4P/T4SS family [Acidisphaera rubrifaciens]GAN78231.1 secretion system type II kinase GspE [Acidisphaera rubrifaciens HS-AP3]
MPPDTPARTDTPPPAAAAAIEAALVARNLLSGAALERVKRLETESGERVDLIAAKLGLISDRDLAQAYADMLDASVLAQADFPAEAVAPDRLLAAFLKRARVVPVAESDTALVVAMADPFDARTLRALQFATGRRIVARAAVPADIDAAHDRLYGDGRSAIDQISDAAGDRDASDREADLERLKDLASEAPVIRLVNSIITRAVEMAASDIHLESTETDLRVRYRVDGMLREMDAPPARLRSAVISRIKIMAKLNIAERRLPQDGRIRLAVRGKEIDFRVSTTPAIHGESVVLRILDRGSLALDFAALGFDETQLPVFLETLARPHGIVLVSGPTGSGKTTTLYAALTHLNSPDRKILTAENPVEYVLPGINQVQINPDIGLNFANALHSFLRQDPDIMMIGEIRNLETAQIAVQAALTGHLVLSTVHTNDAGSAMARLLDMGIENYLLNSTVNAVLGQRLVRRLCASCRQPYAPGDELARTLGLPPAADGAAPVLYRPAGCPACGGLGYSGRTMILELMVMNDAIRSLVLARAEAREIQTEAIRSGMQTMYMHGLRKAVAGITTIEEVFRVTREA